MKKHTIYWLFCYCFFLIACQSNQSDQTTSTTPPPPTTAPAPQETPPPPTRPDCPLSGQLLEGNESWLAQQALLVRIIADSTTFDQEFGESHRILEVYDANCKRIHRQTLAINFSPDFPYYLSTEGYNDSLGMICVQGFDFVYCYDAANRRAVPELRPSFRTERIGVDAQSGSPLGLRYYQHYLIGAAMNFGAYAFDCSVFPPKAILPKAEYRSQQEDYNDLFLLKNKENRYQCVYPAPNFDDGGLGLTLLADQAFEWDSTSINTTKDGRWVVITTKEESKMAIDLEQPKAIELPEEIAKQAPKAVLKYLGK